MKRFALKPRRGLLIALFSALCCTIASAEPHETIINNGPATTRVDIAILGDGYTAAEMTKYRNDVQEKVQSMFAQDPYREYQRYFNVHRIDVASNQSGADHPENSVFVDTAFDSTYNCAGTQRLICVNTTKVFGALQRSLAPVQYDIKLVIVNDPVYGGSGGAVAVASTNGQAVELILHEVAHSFGLLMDEYGGSTCAQTSEPSGPNITTVTARNQIKWNYWIEDSTPVPTSVTTPGLPGLYVGGLFCDNGYHRPTYDSKMRTLGQPFEQINTEQLVKRIYNFVSPIEGVSPVGSSLSIAQGQSVTFSVTKPLPLTHNLEVTWFVDGQPQSSGNSFVLNASSASVGSHSLEVLVKDNTPWVRRDLGQLLSDTRTWTINVAPPIPPPSFPPVLQAVDGSQRAIALDSVHMLRDPFSTLSQFNFSADGHTRVALYATDFDWASGQNVYSTTAWVEIGSTTIPMTVEYVGAVPNFSNIAMIVVRLPDGLPSSGDVFVRIALSGVQSNRVIIGLKPSQ